MRKKLGTACMVVGILLMISALALFIYNHAQANRAKQYSADAVSLLKEEIADGETQSTDSKSDASAKKQMREVEIDGYNYVGYLSIPSINLELPVMSQWDYQRLQIAPCRYSGTVTEKNMVVIAHNYYSHFGTLDQLETDDEVRFTDVNGDITAYKVTYIDVVPPTSEKEVVAGDSALALVTCTYGGKTRFVVYCDES